MVKYLDNLTVEGEEGTRSKLAILLLKLTVGMVSFTLLGSFILIGMGKLEVNNAITLILAISTIFSGLLASAITYYFTSK